MPINFLDHRVTGLSDRARVMVLTLESFARDSIFCFPSNETLAAMIGCSTSKLQERLAEVESAGWIKRIHGTRNQRLGIVMLRRVDPVLPAADTPKKLALAEDAVQSRRKRSRQHPDSGTPSPPISGASSIPISGPEETLHGEVTRSELPRSYSAHAATGPESDQQPLSGKSRGRRKGERISARQMDRLLREEMAGGSATTVAFEPLGDVFNDELEPSRN